PFCCSVHLLLVSLSFFFLSFLHLESIHLRSKVCNLPLVGVPSSRRSQLFALLQPSLFALKLHILHRLHRLNRLASFLGDSIRVTAEFEGLGNNRRYLRQIES